MRKPFVVLMAAVMSVMTAGTCIAENAIESASTESAVVEEAISEAEAEAAAAEPEEAEEQADDAQTEEPEEQAEEGSFEEAAEGEESEEMETDGTEAGEDVTKTENEAAPAQTDEETAPAAPAADGTGAQEAPAQTGAQGTQTAAQTGTQTAAQTSQEPAPAAQNAEAGFEYEDVFAQWNPDAPALHALVDYVEDVTNEASANYIPPVDRIAVFDMDGTLYGELFPTYLEYYMLAWRILEDPSIEPDAEMLEVGRILRDCALDNSFPEDMAMQHAVQAARAYAGMTLNEFSDFVTEILLREVDGFEGMTYGEAFYEPMIEVVDYLNENGFSVYLVSGSDRYLCRTLLEGMVDIPADHIIGMDVYLEGSGQAGADSLDYVFKAEDDVIRTDRLMIKNLKMNKVYNIVQEIGRQPVLSFGNSSGDVSMHEYTINKNKYKSAAFMLVADDADRDYANLEKTEPLLQKWADAGYQVVSMKNDFLTIYGEGVVKTGSFHWLEELAENRVPAEAAKGEEAEETAEEEAPVEEAAAEEAAAEVPADETAAEEAPTEEATAEEAPAEEATAEEAAAEEAAAEEATAEEAAAEEAPAEETTAEEAAA